MSFSTNGQRETKDIQGVGKLVNLAELTQPLDCTYSTEELSLGYAIITFPEFEETSGTKLNTS